MPVPQLVHQFPVSTQLLPSPGPSAPCHSADACLHVLGHCCYSFLKTEAQSKTALYAFCSLTDVNTLLPQTVCTFFFCIRWHFILYSKCCHKPFIHRVSHGISVSVCVRASSHIWAELVLGSGRTLPCPWGPTCSLGSGPVHILSWGRCGW